MSEYTYIQLLNKTLKYYFEEKYKEGYNFLNKHLDTVEGNQAQLYNFLYTLACKSGQPEKAIELLKEAVCDKDYWYAAQYLREDDDLDPIREYDDFKKIIETCEKREKIAHKETKSKLKVYVPETKESERNFSLFITLHGNQENIKIIKDYWKEVVNKNYILAVPQSSQIEFYEAYVWDDIELGVKELKVHYINLISNYNVDNNKIILGGFSAGARVILEAVKNEIIQPKGIVLMAPWLPEIKDEKELFKKFKEHNIKVYILCGKEDRDCLEYCNIFVDKLSKSEVGYKYDLIERLEHDYPQDFTRRLKRALEYIEG